MTGIFQPTLQSNIQPETTPRTPIAPSFTDSVASALPGILDTAGSFLETEDTSDSDYAKALQLAEKAKTNGLDKKARAIFKKASVQYAASGGNPYHEKWENTLNIMGITPTYLNPAEAYEQKITSTPEYTSFYAYAKMTSPEADADELHDKAVQLTSENLAHQGILSQEAIDAELKIPSMVSILNSEMRTIETLATSFTTTGNIASPEQINAARMSLMGTIAGMREQLVNVPAGKRSGAEAAFDDAIGRFDVMASLMSSKNLTEQAKVKLISSIQKLDIPDSDKTAAINILNADNPQALVSLLQSIGTGEATEIMHKALKSLNSDTDLTTGDSAENKDVQRAASQIFNGDKVAAANSEPLRKQMLKYTANTKQAVSKMKAGEFYDPEDLKNIFSPEMLAHYEELANVAPSQAREFRRNLGEAVDIYTANAIPDLESIATSIGITVTEDGTIDVDPEALMQAANVGLTANVTKEVNRLYGGDWEELWRDRGFRIRDTDDPDLLKVRRHVATNHNKGKDLLELKEGLDYLQDFVGNMAEPAASVDAPELGKYQQIIELIDATEGQGDYDKLFNNLEKTNGHKVSENTINENLAWARRSGYGSKVKNALRRAGKNPVYSTPMGRWQIVASTLSDLVKSDPKLTGNEIFDERMQDYLFVKLAERRLKQANGDVDKAIQEFTKEWEGLGNKKEELRSVLESLMNPVGTVSDVSQNETKEST